MWRGLLHQTASSQTKVGWLIRPRCSAFPAPSSQYAVWHKCSRSKLWGKEITRSCISNLTSRSVYVPFNKVFIYKVTKICGLIFLSAVQKSEELSELWFNTLDFFFFLNKCELLFQNSHNKNFRCYFWIVQKPFYLLYSSFFSLSSLSLSLRWRMSTIMLPSLRTLSTTQLSWRTHQRMCQSSVSKRRTLISPPLQAALVTASLLATHRISSLSTPEPVRLAALTHL